MDMHAAYREVGSYRAAADICGTTPKTVKRSVEAARRAEAGVDPGLVRHNYDGVADLVAETVARTKGRITAKRLLPVAVAAGYGGSARNFRRLVADAKSAWRSKNHRGRRPGVWAPGDMVVFDWGEMGPLFVFCAVVGWSRYRFVYFTDNLGAEATMEALAECFERIGGVPKTALTDRMGCLKGGTVAGLVIPTPAYVRFATRDAALLELMFAHKHSAHSDSLQRAAESAFSVMLELIEQGQAEGVLHRGEPERVGLVLFATIQGIAALVTGGMLQVDQVDQLLTDAIERFLSGSPVAARR